MHFIAIAIGVVAAVAFWFIASRWVARSVLWAESRYPRFVGTWRLRTWEVFVCGLLVLACLALVILIDRAMV